MVAEFLCNNAHKVESLGRRVGRQERRGSKGARVVELADIDDWDTVFQGIPEY